jgi:hypothetical protein
MAIVAPLRSFRATNSAPQFRHAPLKLDCGGSEVSREPCWLCRSRGTCPNVVGGIQARVVRLLHPCVHTRTEFLDFLRVSRIGCDIVNLCGVFANVVELFRGALAKNELTGLNLLVHI